jgi:hypothetical protein
MRTFKLLHAESLRQDGNTQQAHRDERDVDSH